MNSKIKIIGLNSENVSEYEPVCFLNPKNEGYQKKLEWLKKRFSEGLLIKQLYSEEERKCIGFIEYTPGEYAWRAVEAKGYVFIHCIWISPNKFKEKGYGSLLVEECIKDAKNEGKYGVAVVTSEGPFMAGKDLFLRNGFKSVAKAKPSYELMIKTLKKGPLPKFTDWEKKLSEYEGLNIIYANQCPWVARSIEDLGEIAKKKAVEVKMIELKSAKETQNAISNTRFLNILKKELQLKD